MNKTRAGIDALGIAWEMRPRGKKFKTFYVGSVQGDGGKDWGWTDRIGEAMPLTPYWRKRFLADRRACGIHVND